MILHWIILIVATSERLFIDCSKIASMVIGKRANLNTGVSGKQRTPNFPNNKHFLPSNMTFLPTTFTS